MLYILNSPVLTSCGVYSYAKIPLSAVRELLKQTPDFISAVGHESTANFISKILGVTVPVNRIEISMKKGDKAIVFRILTRLPEGKVLDEQELSQVKYEIGLLKKVYEGSL